MGAWPLVAPWISHCCLLPSNEYLVSNLQTLTSHLQESGGSRLTNTTPVNKKNYYSMIYSAGFNLEIRYLNHRLKTHWYLRWYIPIDCDFHMYVCLRDTFRGILDLEEYIGGKHQASSTQISSFFVCLPRYFLSIHWHHALGCHHHIHYVNHIKYIPCRPAHAFRLSAYDQPRFSPEPYINYIQCKCKCCVTYLKDFCSRSKFITWIFLRTDPSAATCWVLSTYDISIHISNLL